MPQLAALRPQHPPRRPLRRPNLTEAAAVSESAGISRETREYIEALCALIAAEQEVATWGEKADQIQKYIDFLENNEPPAELRDLFEANVAMQKLIVRFAKEHRSLSYEDEEAWNEYIKGPEMQEANTTLGRAIEALDDAVLEVLSCS